MALGDPPTAPLCCRHRAPGGEGAWSQDQGPGRCRGGRTPARCSLCGQRGRPDGSRGTASWGCLRWAGCMGRGKGRRGLTSHHSVHFEKLHPMCPCHTPACCLWRTSHEPWMSGTPTSRGPRVDSMVGGCPRMPQGDGERAVAGVSTPAGRQWVTAPPTTTWEGLHGAHCADEDVVVRGVLVSGWSGSLAQDPHPSFVPVPAAHCFWGWGPKLFAPAPLFRFPGDTPRVCLRAPHALHGPQASPHLASPLERLSWFPPDPLAAPHALPTTGHRMCGDRSPHYTEFPEAGRFQRPLSPTCCWPGWLSHWRQQDLRHSRIYALGPEAGGAVQLWGVYTFSLSPGWLSPRNCRIPCLLAEG